MRRVILALGIIVIGSVVPMGSAPIPARSDDGAEEGQLPEVSVTLAGSPQLIEYDKVEGVERPGGGAVSPFYLSKPHRLTIHLPDGRAISLATRSMSPTTYHGVVLSVYLRRPLKPMRFRDAVADFRRTMEDLGIEPDEKTVRTMATWPEDDPNVVDGFGLINGGGRFPVSDEVDLGFEMQPDPRGGWCYLIAFSIYSVPEKIAQASLQLAALSADADAPQGPPDGDDDPSDEVTLRMLQSVQEVEGMDLHPNLPKISITARERLLRPHRLVLDLSDDRRLSLDARGMVFLSHYGIVETILVRPMLHSSTYQEAVAAVHQVLKELGVEPGPRMRGQMDDWPADVAWSPAGVAPYELRAEMPLTDRVNLIGLVRPDSRGGWFPLLIFDPTTEATKAAQRSARTPDAELGREGRP